MSNLKKRENLKPQKILTTIRLDEDVVNAFKKEGPGYQTRINEALRTLLPMKRRRK